MAYLISRHPLLVITLSVATSIFAALTGTRLVNLTIIDMSTGMNAAGTIQAREAAAVQELVKRAAGRAERLARTRSHARPSTPSPPPAQPTPLAPIVPLVPQPPPQPPHLPSPPALPGSRIPLDNATLRACIGAYGFSECSTAPLVDASIRVEPAVSERADDAPRILVHMMDAVLPTTLGLRVDAGVLGGAEVHLLAGTSLVITPRLSPPAAASSSATFGALSSAVNSSTGAFSVPGQRGKLSGGLTVVGYGPASSLVPVSAAQQLSLLGEATTEGARHCRSPSLAETARASSPCTRASSPTAFTRASAYWCACISMRPSLPPRRPRRRHRSRRHHPYPAQHPRRPCRCRLRLLRRPRRPRLPRRARTEHTPPAPPPPLFPPGTLLEPRQRNSLEYAIFTFRRRGSHEAVAAADRRAGYRLGGRLGSGGVFTNESLFDILHQHKSLVGDPS